MPKIPIPDLPDFFNRLPRFGEQLRDHRMLRGRTIEEVAAAVGLAPSALSDMELGRRAAPPKDIVYALADTLGFSGADRATLIAAADMGSPLLSAIFERTPTQEARPALPAAILVFLIADIRGYTRFTEQHGDEAAARLTARFADVARIILEHWDGQLVEVRGDEVLGVFASARQALRAAQDLHTRYAEESRTHADWPAGIGIGLDVGEAVPVENGYRGAALNRAARLCSLAGPGEVLVSTGVVYVAPQVDGMAYVARGQEHLKGFDRPVPILLAAPNPARSVVEASADALDDL
jgi:class 3 adenylate cyclase